MNELDELTKLARLVNFRLFYQLLISVMSSVACMKTQGTNHVFI